MPKRRSPGDGSIYQRASDGLWVACPPSYLDSNGKRVRPRPVYAKTRALVREKLKQAIQEAQHNAPSPVGPKQTFGEFLVHWLEHTDRPHIRPTVYVGRRIAVHKHILPAMGDVALQSLTAEHVERFQAAKLAEGKAPATVRQYRVLIIACLEAAVQRGYIPRNVGKLAGSFRSPPPIIRCMDAAQARTFLEAAQEDRFYALYLIALTLGLRKGELLALRWQDVDLDKATLSVNGSMQRIEGREVRVETKTAHSNRTLRLTPQIVDALRARRDLQQFEARMEGDTWHDTGYIFTSRFGTSAGRENILTYFQAILREAGLPKVTLHSLRHTAATLALMSGVPIHVVSRMLGHASIVITLNRYAHLMPALEEQAVDILATMYA